MVSQTPSKPIVSSAGGSNSKLSFPRPPALPFQPGHLSELATETNARYHISQHSIDSLRSINLSSNSVTLNRHGDKDDLSDWIQKLCSKAKATLANDEKEYKQFHDNLKIEKQRNKAKEVVYAGAFERLGELLSQERHMVREPGTATKIVSTYDTNKLDDESIESSSSRKNIRVNDLTINNDHLHIFNGNHFISSEQQQEAYEISKKVFDAGDVEMEETYSVESVRDDEEDEEEEDVDLNEDEDEDEDEDGESENENDYSANDDQDVNDDVIEILSGSEPEEKNYRPQMLQGVRLSYQANDIYGYQKEDDQYSDDEEEEDRYNEDVNMEERYDEQYSDEQEFNENEISEKESNEGISEMQGEHDQSLTDVSHHTLFNDTTKQADDIDISIDDRNNFAMVNQYLQAAGYEGGSLKGQSSSEGSLKNEYITEHFYIDEREEAGGSDENEEYEEGEAHKESEEVEEGGDDKIHEESEEDEMHVDSGESEKSCNKIEVDESDIHEESKDVIGLLYEPAQAIQNQSLKISDNMKFLGDENESLTKIKDFEDATQLIDGHELINIENIPYESNTNKHEHAISNPNLNDLTEEHLHDDNKTSSPFNEIVQKNLAALVQADIQDVIVNIETGLISNGKETVNETNPIAAEENYQQGNVCVQNNMIELSDEGTDEKEMNIQKDFVNDDEQQNEKTLKLYVNKPVEEVALAETIIGTANYIDGVSFLEDNNKIGDDVSSESMSEKNYSSTLESRSAQPSVADDGRQFKVEEINEIHVDNGALVSEHSHHSEQSLSISGELGNVGSNEGNTHYENTESDFGLPGIENYNHSKDQTSRNIDTISPYNTGIEIAGENTVTTSIDDNESTHGTEKNMSEISENRIDLAEVVKATASDKLNSRVIGKEIHENKTSILDDDTELILTPSLNTDNSRTNLSTENKFKSITNGENDNIFKATIQEPFTVNSAEEPMKNDVENDTGVSVRDPKKDLDLKNMHEDGSTTSHFSSQSDLQMVYSKKLEDSFSISNPEVERNDYDEFEEIHQPNNHQLDSPTDVIQVTDFDQLSHPKNETNCEFQTTVSLNPEPSQNNLENQRDHKSAEPYGNKPTENLGSNSKRSKKHPLEDDNKEKEFPSIKRLKGFVSIFKPSFYSWVDNSSNKNTSKPDAPSSNLAKKENMRIPINYESLEFFRLKRSLAYLNSKIDLSHGRTISEKNYDSDTSSSQVEYKNIRLGKTDTEKEVEGQDGNQSNVNETNEDVLVEGKSDNDIVKVHITNETEGLVATPIEFPNLQFIKEKLATETVGDEKQVPNILIEDANEDLETVIQVHDDEDDLAFKNFEERSENVDITYPPPDQSSKASESEFEENDVEMRLAEDVSVQAKRVGSNPKRKHSRLLEGLDFEHAFETPTRRTRSGQAIGSSIPLSRESEVQYNDGQQGEDVSNDSHSEHDSVMMGKTNTSQENEYLEQEIKVRKRQRRGNSPYKKIVVSDASKEDEQHVSSERNADKTSQEGSDEAKPELEKVLSLKLETNNETTDMAEHITMQPEIKQPKRRGRPLRSRSPPKSKRSPKKNSASSSSAKTGRGRKAKIVLEPLAIESLSVNEPMDTEKSELRRRNSIASATPESSPRRQHKKTVSVDSASHIVIRTRSGRIIGGNDEDSIKRLEMQEQVEDDLIDKIANNVEKDNNSLNKLASDSKIYEGFN